MGFNSPLHRHSSSDMQDHESGGNPLYLIKEEIAIMKKLNHNNLVSLVEVLDDPDEDSLYMVLEMCKKGVVMKVGVDERADPYDEESCRCWFRDLILGIEYLHAQESYIVILSLTTCYSLTTTSLRSLILGSRRCLRNNQKCLRQNRLDPRRFYLQSSASRSMAVFQEKLLTYGQWVSHCTVFALGTYLSRGRVFWICIRPLRKSHSIATRENALKSCRIFFTRSSTRTQHRE